MRQTGILMPASSLPSRTGIGELGPAAYRWIEMMKESGAGIWQILPLNPVGYGNSPYQPYSSYAGDELYISLDVLFQEGLLKEQPEVFREKAVRVDYDAVRAFKLPYLKRSLADLPGAGAGPDGGVPDLCPAGVGLGVRCVPRP